MARKSKWFGDSQPKPPGWREYQRTETGLPGAFYSFSWWDWIIDLISIPAPPDLAPGVAPGLERVGPCSYPAEGERYRLSFDRDEIERLARFYEAYRNWEYTSEPDERLGERLRQAANQLRDGLL